VKAFSSLETYIDEHYTSRCTLAFLPSELRKMREKCLAGNDLGELMIWVILLLSSKQYLRACEVLELTVESWKMNYAAISESDVQSILLSVCGKRDGVKDVHLQCWTDRECPEFSACTAVLIWLAVSGIKSGFLFPRKELLKRGATPSNSEKHYNYKYYLDDIRFLTLSVLKRCLDIPGSEQFELIGTHSGRKTGALLAVFGFLIKSSYTESIEDPIFQAALKHDLRESGGLRKDMRQEGLGATMVYIADSATLASIVANKNPNDTSVSGSKCCVGTELFMHSHFVVIYFKFFCSKKLDRTDLATLCLYLG
jgi:hypothetical protein